jgi:hypothetical protein
MNSIRDGSVSVGQHSCGPFPWEKCSIVEPGEVTNSEPMKPWWQTEFYWAVLSVAGGILWIWRSNRNVRREKQKPNPNPDAVKKLRTEEWGAWFLTTIGVLEVLVSYPPR